MKLSTSLAAVLLCALAAPALAQNRPGSIYQPDNGPTSLIADKIALRTGDLLTVVIQEQQSVKNEEASDLSRSTNLNYKLNVFDWTNGSYDQPMGSGGGKGGAGPWCGHSWPRQGSGVNWMSALAEGGCGPGINLVEMGGPQQGEYDVGTGGGYGGIYCFALQP